MRIAATKVVEAFACFGAVGFDAHAFGEPHPIERGLWRSSVETALGPRPVADAFQFNVENGVGAVREG